MEREPFRRIRVVMRKLFGFWNGVISLNFHDLFMFHYKLTGAHTSVTSEPVKCLRPYHVECTGSRPITEVKQRRAWLVLGWVTAWEPQVL